MPGVGIQPGRQLPAQAGVALCAPTAIPPGLACCQPSAPPPCLPALPPCLPALPPCPACLQGDFFSLHMPLTPNTKGLFNDDAFGKVGGPTGGGNNGWDPSCPHLPPPCLSVSPRPCPLGRGQCFEFILQSPVRP